MFRLLISFLLTFTIILFIFAGCAAAAEPPASDLNTTKVYKEAILEAYDKQELINQIKACELKITYANQLIAAAKGLGYTPNHQTIKMAEQERMRASGQKTYYQSILNVILEEEKLWEQRMSEYPEATTVWLYLKDLGYNDYVCAGILGNMMSECGGHTLALQTEIIGGYAYYGICQWSRTYCPEVWKTDLNTQLDYLRDTIEKEFNTFGYLYKRNFDYEAFIALEDCEAVALAFAKCYERCNSNYYYVREDDALVAYEYFVGESDR